jgi:hypothetical protein
MQNIESIICTAIITSILSPLIFEGIKYYIKYIYNKKNPTLNSAYIELSNSIKNKLTNELLCYAPMIERYNILLNHSKNCMAGLVISGTDEFKNYSNYIKNIEVLYIQHKDVLDKLVCDAINELLKQIQILREITILNKETRQKVEPILANHEIKFKFLITSCTPKIGV